MIGSVCLEHLVKTTLPFGVGCFRLKKGFHQEKSLSLSVLITGLTPSSVSWLIVDFVSIKKKFFGSICMCLKRRVYVAGTA